LYVKGDKRVGEVTVRLDGGDLKVSYKVKKGWYIKQTNLDLSDNYNGLHLQADGSPVVEAFPYNTQHFTAVKSADYTISASQWPLGTDLYVAAQAIVIQKTKGKCVKHSAYEFAAGLLSFAPNQTSAQFEVTPIDDSEVESVESLSLQLSNPLGAELANKI
jgi:hypothetical protein